jgi:outer membrane protein assembly factor BamB
MNTMTTIRLLFVLLALCLTSGAFAQSMFRGNAAHTGVFPGAAPREFHRLKWKFPTGNRVLGSPVLEGKMIYFGSDDGNLYALEAASGQQLWKTATRGPISSTPAVANGLVYFGSYDGKFYALDARSGITKWKFATEGDRRFEAKGLHGMQPKTQTIADPFDTFLSSPVVADGTVYFGSGDGNLYALDATTGDLRWKFKAGDVIHASPAFANGVVFVGSFDSYFYAVDAKSGKEKWRFHGGEDAMLHNQVGFQSSPAVVDGVVYTGCRDAQLYAIDAATGKE